MIHHLMTTALTQLCDHLGGLLDAPEEHVVIAPAQVPGEDLPRLVLSPGPFTMNARAKAPRADSPRPQPAQQRIVLDAAQGPYPLAHTPLAESVRGQLILDDGTLSEHRELWVEGADLSIDYAQATVTLNQPLPSPGVLLLDYTFAGIFTVREFQQTLLLDITAADFAAAEQWASLATGVLLTHTDTLLAGAQAVYESGRAVSTTHHVAQFDLVDGTPSLSASQATLRLTFSATGHMQLVRAIDDGFGVIEQIHSPGVTSTSPVAIQAELG